MSTIDQLLALKKRTNNILHAVLSVFTLGLWLWIWLYCLWSNERHNARVDEQVRHAALMNWRHG